MTMLHLLLQGPAAARTQEAVKRARSVGSLALLVERGPLRPGFRAMTMQQTTAVRSHDGGIGRHRRRA